MADQDLNQSSPGALNQGNPPSLSPPLTPAPPTPSTAQNTPPPTASDATSSPSTTATANSGAVPGVMGRASTGAPAQPAGEGLNQGGNTTVIVNNGGGGGGAGLTLGATQTGDFTPALNTIYPCDPTGGAFNANLPPASAGSGEIVLNVASDSNNGVTPVPSGSDTINGAAGPSAALLARESITLFSDGVSNWMVVQ